MAEAPAHKPPMSANAIQACPPKRTLHDLRAGHLAKDIAENLRTHIEECYVCTSVLLDGVDSIVGSADRSVAVGASGVQFPEMVAEFRLLRLLGQGAMGQVFLARDSFLNRLVALKFLASVETTSAARERFYVEARAVARVQHPNVVTLYRVGEEGGRPFLVSEFIRGESLERHQKPMPSDKVLAIGLGIARGLAAAHQRGVLHRDIKPANVVVSTDGEVRLLDFGLAKLIEVLPGSTKAFIDGASQTVESLRGSLSESLQTASPTLTKTGAMMGTPLYMAPESWRAEEATPQTDVYSVGALLFELCSGRPPHVAETAYALMGQVTQKDAVSLASVVPAVDGRLAAIVDRCLRREPAQRYGSGSDLCQALEALSQKARSTLPLKLGGLILSCALLAAIGALAWRQQRMNVEEKDRADLANQTEMGLRASALAMQPGQESGALALAIKAVAPSLQRGQPAPISAHEALQTAYSLAKTSVPVLGHSDRVDVVTFDGTGQFILTGSADRTARVWDAHTGQQVLILTGHHDAITSVAYTRARTLVLTTSADHTARLWDAHSGVLLHELLGHGDIVSSGIFSPDETRILTGGHDGTARLWDTQTGRLLVTLSGHGDPVPIVTFSPHGHYILTASWDNSARLWDGRTGKLLRVLSGHNQRLSVAGFAPDGQHIVTGSWDGTLRLWDVRKFDSIVLKQGSSLRALAFSPNGQWLVTTGSDGFLKLWSLPTGTAGAQLLGHNGTVDAVDFAPDSRHIVTGGADHLARLWEVGVGQPIATFVGHRGTISKAVFSPSGDQMVTVSRDESARIWDVRADRPLGVLSGHKRAITSASFSPDATRIVTTSADSTARIWRWPGGDPIAELRDHTDDVLHAAFSPDGNLIATASRDQSVILWDSNTGQRRKLLIGNQGPVWAVAFSPDGSRLVSGGYDRMLRFWETSTGTLRQQVQAHRDRILSIAFSKDGKYLVTTGSEGEVWLRDGGTATPIRKLGDYAGRRINHAEFFSEGSQLRLALASGDRTVEILDPILGNTLSTIHNSGSAVLAISLSPGAQRLLTLSRGHGVRLWDMAAKVPVALIPDTIEEMATASFTPSAGNFFLVGYKDGMVKVFADDFKSDLADTLRAACGLLLNQGEFEQVRAECRNVRGP